MANLTYALGVKLRCIAGIPAKDTGSKVNHLVVHTLQTILTALFKRLVGFHVVTFEGQTCVLNIRKRLVALLRGFLQVFERALVVFSASQRTFADVLQSIGRRARHHGQACFEDSHTLGVFFLFASASFLRLQAFLVALVGFRQSAQTFLVIG